VRSLSNDVVAIFDDLDDMKASIPFVGTISAMDVVRDTFPGMGDAEEVIRDLDAELNKLRDNSASLRSASERIRGLAELNAKDASGNMPLQKVVGLIRGKTA
jgi:hypothetical protein